MKYISPGKIIVILLIGTLINCTTIRNYQDTQGPLFTGNYSLTENTIPASLKVVTFNIKFAQEVEQALSELKELPGLAGADVILLQEMDESGVDYIARNLQMDYVYYPACFQRHDKNFGNAILSKWSISRAEKYILPHINPINKQHRIAVAATIRHGNQSIRVYSIHTEVNVLGLEKRLDQVKYITSTIPDSVSHVIIGGDFNSVFGSTVARIENIFQTKELDYISKTAPATFQPDPLGLIQLKLDHLFAKGMTVMNTGVAENSTASDHFPVWAEIRLSGSDDHLSLWQNHTSEPSPTQH